MPSTTENIQSFGLEYTWPQAGEEWSGSWGSARAQWEGSILPRIFPLLGGRILEIAPGHGRWTQFLRHRCTSLIGVDISPSCVEYCRDRFPGDAHLEFYANDGLTLPMVADASIDFAISFDSLVHAEADALASYVGELARVLKPGAAAFIHHSNFGGAGKLFRSRLRRGVQVIRNADFAAMRRFVGIGATHRRYPAGTPGWRAHSMTAQKMRDFAARSGLSCLQQELINWDNAPTILLDCMSTLVNQPGHECAIIENYQFMQEAARIKRMSACSQTETG